MQLTWNNISQPKAFTPHLDPPVIVFLFHLIFAFAFDLLFSAIKLLYLYYMVGWGGVGGLGCKMGIGVFLLLKFFYVCNAEGKCREGHPQGRRPSNWGPFSETLVSNKTSHNAVVVRKYTRFVFVTGRSWLRLNGDPCSTCMGLFYIGGK